MKYQQIKMMFIDQSCLFSSTSWIGIIHEVGDCLQKRIFFLWKFPFFGKLLFPFKVDGMARRLPACLGEFSIRIHVATNIVSHPKNRSFLRHEKLSTFLYTLFPGTAEQSILTVQFHVPSCLSFTIIWRIGKFVQSIISAGRKEGNQ